MSPTFGSLIGPGARTEVITFRVTPSEKALLEEARHEAGHPSIGHYVRQTAVQRARTIIDMRNKVEPE